MTTLKHDGHVPGQVRVTGNGLEIRSEADSRRAAGGEMRGAVTGSWCLREGARHGRAPAAEKGSSERGHGGCPREGGSTGNSETLFPVPEITSAYINSNDG